MLSSLPLELLIKIVQELDAVSVLRLCTTSKALRRTVLDLSESKYIVGLYRCGMEDGPNTSLSLSERLVALGAYRQDRVDLKFSEDKFSFYPGASGMRIARGMVWSWDRNRVYVYRLSCPQRGVTFKHWVVDLDGNFEPTVVNSSIDLLIVMRRDGISDTKYFFPKLLSTGATHSLAKRPSFPIDFAGLSLRQLDTYGRYIILRFQENRGDFFAIYDWRSGEAIMTTPKTPDIWGNHDAFFFDEKYLVLADARSEGKDLELTFSVYALESQGVSHDSPALVFHFPKFTLAGLSALRVQSNGTRGGCSGDDAYFQEDATNRLFTINFDLLGLAPSEGRHVKIYALASSFSTHFSRADHTGATVHIPFDEWGSRGVRIWSTPPRASTLAASALTTLSTNGVLRFVDFHPRRIAWAQSSGELATSGEGARHNIVVSQEEKEALDSKFFADGKPPVTSAPFIRTLSRPIQALCRANTPAGYTCVQRIASGRFALAQYHNSIDHSSYCHAFVF